MFSRGSTLFQSLDGNIVFMTLPLAICVNAKACLGWVKSGGPGAWPSSDTPPVMGTGDFEIHLVEKVCRQV